VFDPADPATLYVTGGGSVGRPWTLVAFDLRAGNERWRRADACPAGGWSELVASRDVIACAGDIAPLSSDLETETTVAAFSHTGEPRWTWKGGAAYLAGAAGDVVLVAEGVRTHVLDARTGRVRFEVPGGHTVAVADPQWGTIVISAERGRLVARTDRADFSPMWSLAVDGAVAGLQRTGDAVLVELADGDAYRVRAADGAVTALPAIGADWTAFDDVLATITPAAPGYAAVPDRDPLPAAPSTGSPPVEHATSDSEPSPPRLWSPIPAPRDGIPTEQITLYEPSGGVRARNDYAIQYAHLGDRGAPDSLVVAHGGPHGGNSFLILDPGTGEPLRSIDVGEVADGSTARPFSTRIDDMPIMGAVVANPLRLLLF
jgi:hypothetical protein